jgi:hypothetical protein
MNKIRVLLKWTPPQYLGSFWAAFGQPQGLPLLKLGFYTHNEISFIWIAQIILPGLKRIAS